MPRKFSVAQDKEGRVREGERGREERKTKRKEKKERKKRKKKKKEKKAIVAKGGCTMYISLSLSFFSFF